MQSQFTKKLRLIPTKHSHVSNVLLSLDAQTRIIGTLDEAGEGTFYTRRIEKHVYRKLNALGINLELLQRQDFHFKWIVVDFCGKRLETSRMYSLYHGSVYNFQKAGFEKQCFLKLDFWGRKAAEAFERTLGQQRDLFGEAA